MNKLILTCQLDDTFSRAPLFFLGGMIVVFVIYGFYKAFIEK